ncbi:hypothetical protein CDL15_Pgr008451 [Punica granatum]|uniref:Uncharacterized protein n=1 Tax=Punica granatum TaxID=22663 RepID=A0A218WP47_PUNGR|nr:hypothetical protein CDL15_Pgr008451 [Punica granatum]
MASINVPGKSSWPELVGKNGGVAATTIIRENPNVYVEMIPPSVTGITSNYISSRVRVIVDDSCIVTVVPSIG